MVFKALLPLKNLNIPLKSLNKKLDKEKMKTYLANLVVKAIRHKDMFFLGLYVKKTWKTYPGPPEGRVH
ncbi:hypothetical protein C3V39_07305 [Prevotella sp. oral taxon 820]|nr:hypothetical protein C3V39_07305 [Prevotella sp. oral taxon 820]